MRVVLFDRGDTLEHDDTLLPGAVETLTAIQALQDSDGSPVVLGLISNFGKPADPAAIPAFREAYCQDLGEPGLGIQSFFEPLVERLTLSSDSTDPEFIKPNAKIFRAALDKISPGLPFPRALFVTEEKPHVDAARHLGMAAVHFKGPGQTTGDVDRLLDLVPVIRQWLA